MRVAKTKPTHDDVSTFISSFEDPSRREESEELIRIMRRASGEDPTLWGDGIIGFGSYHSRYASGREGDWFKAGFAPRSRKLTIYFASGFVGYEDLLSRLGRHTRGKCCVYVRRMSDLDLDILAALIRRCVAHIDQVERDLGGVPRMAAMPPFKP